MQIRNTLWAFVGILLVGCAGSVGTPLPTPALTPSPLPTFTGTPAAEAVQDGPAPTPTLALPESLTTEELHRRLDPFGSTERSCSLPCYNGLLIGQSSRQEALNFYAWLGISVADLIPGDYQATLDGSGRLGAWLTRTSDLLQATQTGLAPPLVDLYIEEDRLQSLYVGWQYYPSYLTLPRVLEVLGQPARLDLALVFSTDPPVYMLRLLYPIQQAGFAFYGFTLGDATHREVCFSADQTDRTFFGVFAPELPPMAGLTYSDYLLSLEETTGISYTDFAAQVNRGECLEIPADRWPAWQAITDQ